jgi:hypothetical protein
MRFAMAMMFVLSACMGSNQPSKQPGGHGGSGSGGSAGSGSDSGGGGSLPAELVGSWISLDQESTYEFDADGFAVFAGAFSIGTDGCTSGVAISYEGDASLDGDVLTIVPTDGTRSVETCGDTTTTAFTDTQTMTVGLTTDAQGPLLSLTDDMGTTVMFHRQ